MRHSLARSFLAKVALCACFPRIRLDLYANDSTAEVAEAQAFPVTGPVEAALAATRHVVGPGGSNPEPAD